MHNRAPRPCLPRARHALLAAGVMLVTSIGLVAQRQGPGQGARCR